MRYQANIKGHSVAKKASNNNHQNLLNVGYAKKDRLAHAIKKIS